MSEHKEINAKELCKELTRVSMFTPVQLLRKDIEKILINLKRFFCFGAWSFCRGAFGLVFSD